MVLSSSSILWSPTPGEVPGISLDPPQGHSVAAASPLVSSAGVRDRCRVRSWAGRQAFGGGVVWWSRRFPLCSNSFAPVAWGSLVRSASWRVNLDGSQLLWGEFASCFLQINEACSTSQRARPLASLLPPCGWPPSVLLHRHCRQHAGGDPNLDQRYEMDFVKVEDSHDQFDCL